MKEKISGKEKERREMMLGGNATKALFLIALPLVFYNSLGQIFQLIDTFIAASLSAGVVSTVSFVAQIEKMLSAVGSGLSVGGGILVARSFGEGNLEKVRRQMSTLFFMAVSIGALILALCVPSMRFILRLMKMPEDLLKDGVLYSMICITSIIFQFVNTIYFSIQKSRGNTKVIMWGNLLVLSAKTAMNLLTMKLVSSQAISAKTAMLLLPAATTAAHLILTFIAVLNLFSRKNQMRISLKSCSFKKEFLRPLASLSIPVFLEKFVFAAGKAIVNSLCAGFGSTVVGALGVSDRICGMSTNPISGFQEAESSLVANNLGNKNADRAISFFYRALLMNLIFVFILFFVTGVFKSQIIEMFARGNAEFAAQIESIYFYERLDTILIAVNTAVMGLLYGFGKTKITMVLNIVRLFVYRIPPLLIFLEIPVLREKLGTAAVGLAMLISNSLVGITAGIVAVLFIAKVKRNSR